MSWRERWNVAADWMAVWVAAALPRRVVEWAAVRLFMHAATRAFGPQEITLRAALRAWKELP